MTDDMPAYGLWSLVVINSAVFILSAFSFFKPRTERDWRSFGAFSAEFSPPSASATGSCFASVSAHPNRPNSRRTI